MSEYFEQYGDLYKEAQTTGKYKMFLLDVKNSKKILQIKGINFHQSLVSFVNCVTEDLLKLEKKLGRKILHRDLESFNNYNVNEHKNKVVLQRTQGKNVPKVYKYDCQNPLLWFGDMMYFIIIRDSISDEKVFEILQKNKNLIVPRYDLHYASGYYETDIWAESGEKFSRTYCISILNELAKKSKLLITTKNKDNIKE